MERSSGTSKLSTARIPQPAATYSITEQESRLRALPIDSPLEPLIEQRLASLRERLDAINQVIDNVGRLNRLMARWSESVAESQHHLSFLDRIQLAFRNAQNLF